MCLSIGAPSVSIWKKATSNRRRGYRLHIYRAGRIQRARHELVELLGVRAQSRSASTRHGSTRLLVFSEWYSAGFRHP